MGISQPRIEPASPESPALQADSLPAEPLESRMSQSCGLVYTSEVEEPEHGFGSARSLSFLGRDTSLREEHR